MTSPAPDPSVAHLIEDRKVLVCVGSGGVGKTTTAAALALYGAQVGKRTLVITIDPARRLANALGLDRLGVTPHPVAPEVRRAAGLPESARLDAMTLDLTHAWDDLIRRTSQGPEVSAAILKSPLYKALSRDLPGAQEFIACEALYALVEDGEHDLIVLDTPPTTNALDFLDAPNRILDMLESDAFKLFASREPSAAAKMGLRFLDGAKGAVYAALSRFTGTEFLDELGQFLALFRGMYEPIRDRTRSLQHLLRSDHSRFLLVTSPNPAPLGEAMAFHRMLLDRQLPVGALIANRTMPAPPGATPGSDPELAAALQRCGIVQTEAERLAPRVGQAAEEQKTTAARDLETLEAARAEIGPGLPLIVVPRLHGDVGDAERLLELVPYLTGSL